jgi:putative transposase
MGSAQRRFTSGRPSTGLDVSEAKRLKSLEDENNRLKRLLADAMLDNRQLEGFTRKKMVTPAARHEAAAHLRSASDE